MKNIGKPYLLTVSAQIKVDKHGVRWADPLWAKDLALHLEYIDDLTLACPTVYADPFDEDVDLSREPFSRVKFVELPRPKNHIDALLMLPALIKAMWSAASENFIVHTGFGSWPISEGLLAAPIAKLQGKFLITNVESSFWRSDTTQETWFNVLRGASIERLNGLCIRAANLRFFTSKAYLRDFLPADAPNAYVVPATWIDSSTILDDETAKDDWVKKENEIRLLFAGRLTHEKGVRVVLDAIRKVSREPISVTIIGDGPLKAECQRLALEEHSRVVLRDPIPYGTAFFTMLRNYDVVVVPSLSDEQPRIIFDAFSQGIPVLGSDTGGIREVVDDGVNGRLVATGNSDALSEIMAWAAHNRPELKTMGLAALSKSRRFTHHAMHERRRDIIARTLENL